MQVPLFFALARNPSTGRVSCKGRLRRQQMFPGTRSDPEVCQGGKRLFRERKEPEFCASRGWLSFPLLLFIQEEKKTID